jgi:hypothetical protein
MHLSAVTGYLVCCTGAARTGSVLGIYGGIFSGTGAVSHLIMGGTDNPFQVFGIATGAFKINDLILIHD